MSLKKKSVMTEVLQKVQDAMQHTYHRISVIEKKLSQQITLDNRVSLEAELSNAKDLLKKNEDKLAKLQKDNTKTFMIAACVIFVIYLLYGLYSMFYVN
ncbi:hypothetical protein TSAR_016070 [Trichomalopsis sarcophagae]|uniref:Coiled-coil domain-containing protein 167 n=1 Tax=Trichomalopsis sarcophagae TaxID=543379 RepID=A0A232ENN4_9HYME|nr:hypothetical protein TSAR_016070 [Trichomalopsis sarcophagae]